VDEDGALPVRSRGGIHHPAIFNFRPLAASRTSNFSSSKGRSKSPGESRCKTYVAFPSVIRGGLSSMFAMPKTTPPQSRARAMSRIRGRQPRQHERMIVPMSE
jgi:hypothetical protein